LLTILTATAAWRTGMEQNKQRIDTGQGPALTKELDQIELGCGLHFSYLNVICLLLVAYRVRRGVLPILIKY